MWLAHRWAIENSGRKTDAHKKDLFMSYEDFPWFQDQIVKSILNVEESSPGHYYWPDIDVDLTEEIIENPERFPLKAGK